MKKTLLVTTALVGLGAGLGILTAPALAQDVVVNSAFPGKFICGNSINADGSSGDDGRGSPNQCTGSTGDNNVTVTTGALITNTGGIYANGGVVYGGYSDTGAVSNNRVIMDDGSVGLGVYGGQSGIGDVSGNQVSLSGGTVGLYVVGGQTANNGRATNNSVSLSGGSVGRDVYGGSASNGMVSGNRVSLSGTAQVTGNVYGGNSSNGDVSGNQVSLSGGSVGGNVYGGQSYSGSITNNSITIDGNATFGTNTMLYGGYCSGTCADVVTGNSLNLATTGISIRGAENFASYNFTLDSTKVGQTILTTTNAINLAGTTVNLKAVSGSTRLVVGDQFTLIDKVTNADQATLNGVRVSQSLIQQVYDFDFTGGISGGPLTATVAKQADPELVPGAENVLSGRTAALATLTSGGDFIADAGVSEARAAAGLGSSGLNAGDGERVTFGTFAAVTGGQMRYHSGGRTVVDGMSLLGGVSAGLPVSTGQAMVGAFAEMGWGSYNSTLGGTTGNGSSRYYGGGILGRYEVSGIYVEGSGRVGQVETTYAGIIDGDNAAAKSHSPYYGLHGGIGYVMPVTNGVNVDLSTKYFWTHQDGNTTNILDGDVRYGAVNSHRWKTGARVNVAVANGVVPYIGGYYEHEFDAKAKATQASLDIPGPSIKGGTGIAELGVTFGAPTDSFKVDLGVTGYAGKRQGAMGSLKAKWSF